MELCLFRTQDPVRSQIHTRVSVVLAKSTPTVPALHAVCRVVSLFTRCRFWSFSRHKSPEVKPDHRVGNLVLAKPTEGSVAKLILLLTFAVAAPANANKAIEQRQHHTAFTATGLPPGISIDPATGVISGVVDRAAITDEKMTYDVQISIHDINGATGRFSIKIVLPNVQPSADDDLAHVSAGVESIISVLENDCDGDGDELTILWATSALKRSVSVEGRSLKYVTFGSVPADDIITYGISDGHGGKAVGHVRVLTVK